MIKNVFQNANSFYTCMLTGITPLGLWFFCSGLVKQACQTSSLGALVAGHGSALVVMVLRLQFLLWLERASTLAALSSACMVSQDGPTISRSLLPSLCLFASLSAFCYVHQTLK